jgi:hypothetical protein
MMTGRSPAPSRRHASGALLPALALLIAGVLLLPGAVHAQSAEDPGGPTRTEPTTCTYQVYWWSTERNRAVNHTTVSQAYSEVHGDERDPLDPRCTVCTEDQETIDLTALGFSTSAGTLQVCWAHRPRVEAALREIAQSGVFDLVDIVGYRPGRTRGQVVGGLRQGMSNHAYGTAIDLNARHNGLYRNCNIREITVDALRACSLGQGGAWNPQQRPRTTITRDGVVYRAFTQTAGWAWGGEIRGAMRDLMHFSLDGT